MNLSSTSIFLFWILVCMPALGVASYYHVKSGKPLAPKRRRFLITMLAEVLLLALALGAKPDSLALFPNLLPDWATLLYAAFFLGAVFLAVTRGMKRIPAERREKARLRLPENAAEFRLWVVISLLAGTCEEVAYRGVLYRLLLESFDSMALALGVAIAAFALAHAMQGVKATLGIAAVGGLLHAVVLLTGTLTLAILIHTTYDLMIGYLWMRSFQAEAQAAATGS